MPQSPKTVRELLAAAALRLRDGSDSAALDAELLLAHALGRPRSHLKAWPDSRPDPETQAGFEALLERRASGEPIAYILGRREFWSLDLDVTAATLIPRPDTEVLVESALERIPRDRGCRVVDLGTGTGAIALALKHERPLATVCATDASLAALHVAAANARRLKLEIEFLSGEWWQPLAARRFDVVVSNPPYIRENDAHLSRGDVRFEPRGALAAGADGLDAIRDIVRGAPDHLERDGWLLLEHGFDQAADVAALLHEAGFDAVDHRQDLNGHARVTFGRWSAA